MTPSEPGVNILNLSTDGRMARCLFVLMTSRLQTSLGTLKLGFEETHQCDTRSHRTQYYVILTTQVPINIQVSIDNNYGDYVPPS